MDSALSAVRQLVKDRLAGRGGGYSSGRQVRLRGSASDVCDECGPLIKGGFFEKYFKLVNFSIKK